MSRKRNGFWMALYGGWLIVIAVLSLDSNPPQIDLGVLSWDKFQHAGAYALLTFLGVMAFRAVGRSPFFTALILFGVSVLFGAVMEIGQGALTPTRFADYRDLLANTLGASVGMTVALAFAPPVRRT